MNKLLFFFGLAVSVGFARGQGTIAFGNNAVARVQVLESDGTTRNAASADNLYIGAFYGPAGSTQDYLVLAPGLATIGPFAGVMVAPSVFPLPGTQPGQVVSLQIRMWNASLGSDWEAVCRANGFLGATDVRQVTLGATVGPGMVIWQTATGTSPNRFHALRQALGPLNINCIPEPSTLRLGALGGALLLRARKPNRE